MTSETTQQAPMTAEPQKEHQWLQRLVGEWTFESEASMGPEKVSGTESVRSLGGLWIIGAGEGEMPGGGSHRSVLTLGYDPDKKRFVGSFISSMMPSFWVYEGELDTGSNVLTLNTEGPSMAGDGKMAKYQETIELLSDDHRVFKSRVLGEGGDWQEFLSMSYRRTR